MTTTVRTPWTREHLLIALNLYTKIPVGKFDKKNHHLIDVAAKMGRTTGSLVMKLCNFMAIDPAQRARGVKGLENGARQDQIVWSEFHESITALGAESEQLLHDLFTADPWQEVDLLEEGAVLVAETRTPYAPTGPTELFGETKLRRGQQFFRQSVLSAYGQRCCISGIDIPKLLVASHIRPWSVSPNERLDPSNGLCLSSLHDKAFDSGLITLDDRSVLVLSSQLKHAFERKEWQQYFAPFDGKQIRLPEERAAPSQDALRYHREHVFVA